MSYQVLLLGDRLELVEGADAYVQEGPLTTFFQGRDGRAVLDSWSRRLASFRTADIVSVRLVVPDLGASAPLAAEPRPDTATPLHLQQWAGAGLTRSERL
jgi:hypothetical protein